MLCTGNKIIKMFYTNHKAHTSSKIKQIHPYYTVFYLHAYNNEACETERPLWNMRSEMFLYDPHCT